MLRFGLFGIPVTIEPWFWLTAALLSGQLLNPSPDAIPVLGAWMFVVLISVMVHELGHAFAYMRYGYSPEIRLIAFGGYATARGGGMLPRGRQLVVSLAGPAAGFALAGVVIVLLQTGVIPPMQELPSGGQRIVFFLLLVNIFLSIINLFPILPLDGGRALSAILGPSREKLTLQIGIGFAVGLGLLAIGMGQPFLAVLAGFLAYQNYQGLQQYGTARWR